MPAVAGMAVKEIIVQIRQIVLEQGKHQKPRQVADEKRGKDKLPGRKPGRPPSPQQGVDQPGKQRNRQGLQKVAGVGIKKEVLKGHIAGKMHEEPPGSGSG